MIELSTYLGTYQKVEEREGSEKEKQNSVCIIKDK